MTNEELDRARVDEAMRLWDGSKGSLAVIAARLAREGWTPPAAVDPDLAEAGTLVDQWDPRGLAGGTWNYRGLADVAIKRGRELERAEAKPGLVWVKHDGSEKCPFALSALFVAKFVPGLSTKLFVGSGEWRDWSGITHYAIITPPAEDVA